MGPDSNDSKRKSLIDAARVYLDRRMLVLLGLGFSSGLPRLLVYSTLTFWLLDVGLKIETVTLFAATAVPYNFKFAWAPILDRLRLPLLARWLGIRRSWILVLQLGLTAAIVVLAAIDPGTELVGCAIAAVVVATLSASQDIVIDAYRVDLLDDDEQGAGAAMAVYGYRIGMLVAGAGALYLVTWFEPLVRSNSFSPWSLTYLAMAGTMGLCVVPTLLAPRTPAEVVEDENRTDATGGSNTGGSAVRVEAPELRGAQTRNERVQRVADWFVDAVLGPFQAFSRRPAWVAILIFVVLFKLGDALAGTVTNPFLDDLGFSKVTIANIGKTYGLVASMVGIGLGGLLTRRIGVIGALWVSGALQLVSNLVFIIQAELGANATFLAVTIGFENLSGGLGTAAFVAYLSGLCDRRYSATQYALLTAMSSTLQTVLSTPTGIVVANVGWATFYTGTVFAAIPGLVVLAYLTYRSEP